MIKEAPEECRQDWSRARNKCPPGANEWKIVRIRITQTQGRPSFAANKQHTMLVRSVDVEEGEEGERPGQQQRVQQCSNRQGKHYHHAIGCGSFPPPLRWAGGHGPGHGLCLDGALGWLTETHSPIATWLACTLDTQYCGYAWAAAGKTDQSPWNLGVKDVAGRWD